MLSSREELIAKLISGCCRAVMGSVGDTLVFARQTGVLADNTEIKATGLTIATMLAGQFFAQALLEESDNRERSWKAFDQFMADIRTEAEECLKELDKTKESVQ